MREADIERLLKQIWRKWRTPQGNHVYVSEELIRIVLQEAIDLDIVRLNEEAPKVVPYSQEKVI
jgi:hypothetical protein